MNEAADPVLSVRGLKKHYPVTKGILRREVGRVKAVDGIDFTLYEGETLGLVGESGCGKSTAATSLLRLEEPTDGEVLYHGEVPEDTNRKTPLEKLRNLRGDDEERAPNDVVGFSQSQLKRFRRKAQMIFQNPTSSFDPRMTVGESVAEPLLIHGLDDPEERREIAEDLLDRVGLDAADYDRYPHEFSGGQKQRVALARALVVNPEFVVADEPVSALDVSIQSEILSLMRDLQDRFGLSMLFISHDMGVIREICDRVAVMYLGEIVEVAPTEELFRNPQHPYTQALLASIPTPDPRQRGLGIELTGDVPSPENPPSGCRFHTRCPKVIQPDDLDLPQEQFRCALDFRHQVEGGDVDAEGATELARAHQRDGDSGDVNRDDRRRALRAEFDLPDGLDDPTAEESVAAAVDSVLDDDLDAAAEQLSDTFTTVCERETPELERTSEDHVAACHLVDGTETVETATSEVADD
ncbi:ABC transporter ATP-binding protein [Haloarchaeobius litoreus]|uniref:ABC transporter ATP-binding protein n=1 Tax=Haloarchaeobius litoreus TaxID=755306 RepID=A0ABD6DFM1_9EURY|nr:oligopeptide/dipeptide ABC transporter ATP-binding protein [Haloarchaeobius litoreus]